MSNKVVLFEYSEKRIDDLDAQFTQRDFDRIENFNTKIRALKHLGTNVLEVVYSHGRPKSLRTTSFVGVIPIGNWTIEILPKTTKDVDKDESRRQAVRNLLYMLSFTKKLTVKEVDVSTLHKVDDDFFEVLIYLYAKNLIETIARNLFKNYVNREENLTFLKGKLKFNDHITRNTVFAHRFFAQFDEFSEDNILNRIFKYTTYLLLHKSRNFENVKLLQQLALMLDDISFTRIGLSDFKRVHLTRLNEEYAPLLNLCKLFISQSSVELSADEMATFSFIFDMNVLFEEFIGEFIKREFGSEYSSIRLQPADKFLVDEKIVGHLRQGSVFRMRPDIILQKDSRDHASRLILDTKYKRLGGLDKKEGVSQSDLYQMHAYSKKYDCPSVVMLYPQTSKESKSFDFYIDGSTVVYVRTVNLCRDLRVDIDGLRAELLEILRAADLVNVAS
jgi:5-methylcytosine-specific restriction enzyme subunit McrC